MIFIYLETKESLRALYLGDNSFEYLPDEICTLENLQIVNFFLELYYYYYYNFCFIS